ncbi:MAG: prepilin-type N-terminal cleavage/methylation domain-containing protein, partial [Pyramidobacter sp.]|nr:prepilin-type N-terminal cleavage/methylation domain-containing protein [Pyramidobacter sp.]
MKNKHGFNLIEITLAIAIIAFGMSSILVLFPTGL